MERLVVGISAKMGSGKSTLADHLVQEHGFVVFSIADPIKHAVARKTNTSFDDNKQRKGIVVDGMTLGDRQVAYGGLKRTKYGPTYWVKKLWDDCVLTSGGRRIVIDDVRMECEAEFLQALGVHLLRLERDVEARRPHWCGRNPDSVTEVDLDDWPGFDAVFANDGTKDELFAEVDDVLALWASN